jgi:mannose-1-phosphate guanylyltransferase
MKGTKMIQPRVGASNKAPERSQARARPNSASRDPLLCGIALAGGEGKRLRPFVHLLRKDLLPKQYVNFIGTRSMLEHTLHRAEKLIPRDRMFTVINEAHLSFPEVEQQISKRPPRTVVIQPENRETAPGLLLPLMHAFKYYPNSIVVVLPSDHFVMGEDTLMHHVELAYRVVKRDPSRLVLLGIEPDQEESEYGYIVPAKSLNGTGGVFRVASFVEKPDYRALPNLLRSGALWNTMMMVFHADTLFNLVREIAPDLYRLFGCVYDAIGTGDEDTVVRQVYQQLRPLNFSKDVLEPYVETHPSMLLGMTVRGVLWSDWGTESRIMEILRRTGYADRLKGLSVALRQSQKLTADETTVRDSKAALARAAKPTPALTT